MSEPQDKILEAFLEELVSDQRPDFSIEILRKLDAESASQDAAVVSAESLLPQVVDVKAAPGRVTLKSDSAAHSAGKWSSVVLAASLLVAAAGLIWWLTSPNSNPKPLPIAEQSQDQLPAVAEGPKRMEKSVPSQSRQDLAQHRPGRSPGRLAPGGVVRKEIPSQPEKLVVPGPFRRAVSPSTEMASAADAAVQVSRQLQLSWQETGTQPADRIGQDAWINRLSNRVIGRTPTASERQQINELVATVSDPADLKSRLVDLFISDPRFRPQYERHWGKVLAWRLLGISTQIGETQVTDPDMVRVREHLTRAVADHQPLDQVSYELVSAVGSTDESREDFNPAASYLVGLSKRFGKRDLATSHISHTFLGQATRCAQCHDASSQVAQSRFWEFYSFFAQMRIEPAGTGTYLVQNRNFLPLAEQGKTQAPLEFTDRTGAKHLANPRLEGLVLGSNGFVAKVDRRTELANFIANSKQWRESLVDLVWASLLNVPLTGIEVSPEHARPRMVNIREHLGQQLLANNFQLDWLVKSIVLSDAFAVGAGTDEQIASDNPYLGSAPRFSRFYHRYASTRAPVQSLAIVAGAYQTGEAAEAFDAGLLARIGEQATQLNPPRTLQPYLPSNDNQWATSENISRQLDQIATSQMSSQKKIQHLVLIALGRPARDAEIEQGEIILENGTDHRLALQDIWWSLLNSIEYQVPLNAH